MAQSAWDSRPDAAYAVLHALCAFMLADDEDI